MAYQSNTQLVQTAPVQSEIVAALDQAAKAGIIATREANAFARMFGVADSVMALQNLLTPSVMRPIMALQGKSLGFKTDVTYPEDIVKSCLIEATLRGLYPVGNQFNIIAKNCYVTKEGFKKLLDDIPGLQYRLIFDIPESKQNGAVITVHVAWDYNGKHEEQDLKFAIRVNAGQGADAIIGKATRKARAWLHAVITGIELPEGDTSDKPLINVTPSENTQTSPFEATTVDNQPEPTPEQLLASEPPKNQNQADDDLLPPPAF